MEALVRTAINLTKPSAGKLLVEEYKEKIKAEAEELVLTQFPKKILDLDTLVKTEKFSLSCLDDVHVKINALLPEPSQNSHNKPPAKRTKLDVDNDSLTPSKVNFSSHAVIPCNKFIVELIDVVKPCIRQLVEDANVLKMWIQFLIPRIEDGNNFGVSIQEETLAEIRTVESDGAAFFDQISRYFITRGKIVSKITKYPHVEDYQRTIRELDEKEYVSLRLVLCELRNHYSSLHDMITKNMEKIKRPRSSNTENMY